ncbi:hypothetical protein HHI36_006789 [Cryptolaemus montrouzieri]|uniref:Uncharacterized protein n=1 Tax=Cryptolaemus montrouzieri TaxID=559131 RepID=A0ABD2NY72_9CUCU
MLHKRQENYECAVIFGNRCQDLLSLLLTKINLTKNNAETRRIKREIYKSQALIAFLRGLQSNLPIRLRNPQNLEQAICFVIEEENFSYAKNNLARQGINPTPVWRPFNSFSNNSQRFAHNRSNHFRQHRAEPMDTSSGNTRRSVRPQAQAQNLNQPKFISEELFQQEVDNNLDHAPNPGCSCEQNYYFDEPSEYLTQETGEVNNIRTREPPLINLTNLSPVCHT